VSLLSGRPVKKGVGMTGEITLRGQVLPVGGIKEKMIAAHRAGLKTIILPKRNEPDLDDLPVEVHKSLSFVFAESVNDVLEASLEKIPPARQRTGGKKNPKKI
jgi:ATP-dependent Lon protease